MAKPKEKFDLEKASDLLVAKYVTTRTSASGLQWRNLYDFVQHCMRIAYTAGRADERRKVSR